jgi:hypothetical protein
MYTVEGSIRGSEARYVYVDAKYGGAIEGGGFIDTVGAVGEPPFIDFEVLGTEDGVISSSSSTNQGLAAKPRLEYAVE